MEGFIKTGKASPAQVLDEEASNTKFLISLQHDTYCAVFLWPSPADLPSY